MEQIVKTPPSNIDFEKLVLGALLIDKKAKDIVLKRIGDNGNVFFDPRHVEIFNALSNLLKKDIPLDIMTLIQELIRTEKLNNAGGDSYVINLTIGISSAAHLDYHCMVVWECYLKRKMINSCMEFISNAYDVTFETPQLFSKIQNHINEIEEEIAAQQDTASAQELFKEVIEMQKTKTIPGVPCKNSELQLKMNGWRNGAFIVIGARPAMGKTAFVLDEALGIAKQGNGVAFVSFEMSAQELQERQMANELEISATKFRDRNLTNYDWQKIYSCSTFENLPLYIIEGKSVNFDLYKTIAKLRLLKKEKNLKLIIWDYIQLTEIAGEKGKNREQIISTISRKMKQTAQELDVPLIALSQLSRSVEQRPGKRPQMSDLRESGAIEQDADIVGFLFRPEYYKIATWDNDEEGMETPTKNEAELMIEKFRGGSTFTERFKFHGGFQRFMPLETDMEGFKNSVPMGSLQDAFEVPKLNAITIQDDDYPF